MRLDERPVAAIAWTTTTLRAAEIAKAVGGHSALFGNCGLRGKPTAPLRYLVNAIRTTRWFMRVRPRVLIVQNPPIVLAVLGLLLTRLTDAELVLDSHPASFGRKGRWEWALAMPAHRYVGRRAKAVLITVRELADEVARWGARPLLLHEAPPEAPSGEARTGGPDDVPDRSVLFVGVFASDEPVGAVIAGAKATPDVTVLITGDVSRARPSLLESAPANVRFVGYLDKLPYLGLLARASVVMALTTEPTSVVRAGYEAVYSGRPLIVSDWPVSREVFPHAVFVESSPSSIAAGVVEALERSDELAQLAPQAREIQELRWEKQLRALQQIIDEPSARTTETAR